MATRSPFLIPIPFRYSEKRLRRPKNSSYVHRRLPQMIASLRGKNWQAFFSVSARSILLPHHTEWKIRFPAAHQHFNHLSTDSGALGRFFEDLIGGILCFELVFSSFLLSINVLPVPYMINSHNLAF